MAESRQTGQAGLLPMILSSFVKRLFMLMESNLQL
jgi:hypothetical protein